MWDIISPGGNKTHDLVQENAYEAAGNGAVISEVESQALIDAVQQAFADVRACSDVNMSA